MGGGREADAVTRLRGLPSVERLGAEVGSVSAARAAIAERRS